MYRLVAVTALAAIIAVPALSEDTLEVPAPGPDAVVEHWVTSEAVMTINVDTEAFAGTYESDDGRIAAKLVDGVWQGFWAEAGSAQECSVELMGSKFWGRISFTFNAERTHFEGTWSYCDAPTEGGGAWTGDRAP